MQHRRAHALPLPLPNAFLGAAVIPFAVADDRLWVLLGQESKSGKWAPFGGRAEHDETPAQTGLRELCEETLSVLGRIEAMAERGKGWWQRPLHVTADNGFVTFAMPMPFTGEQRRLDSHRFLEERKRVTDRLRGPDGAGESSPFLDKAAIFWADSDQVESFDLRGSFAKDWRRILQELRRRTANWRKPGGVRGRVRVPSPERPRVRDVLPPFNGPMDRDRDRTEEGRGNDDKDQGKRKHRRSPPPEKKRRRQRSRDRSRARSPIRSHRRRSRGRSRSRSR